MLVLRQARTKADELNTGPGRDDCKEYGLIVPVGDPSVIDVMEDIDE